MRPLDGTQLAWSPPGMLPGSDNGDSINPSLSPSLDTVGFSGGFSGRPSQRKAASTSWMDRFNSFLGFPSVSQAQNRRSAAVFEKKDKKNWKIWTGLAVTLTGLIGLGIAAHHWNWGGFQTLFRKKSSPAPPKPSPNSSPVSAPSSQSPVSSPKGHSSKPSNPISSGNAAALKIEKLQKIVSSLQGQNLISHLDKQMVSLSSSDIEKCINTNFDTVERPQALEAMTRLTQFGNMASLNTLCQKLKDEDYQVFSIQEGTLASTLHYLQVKHQHRFKPLENPFEFSPGKQIVLADTSEDAKFKSPQEQLTELYKTRDTERKSALILDENLIHQLEKDQDLQKFIQTHKIHLIYPDGWHEGVTVFSQKGIKDDHTNEALDDLVTKTKAVLEHSHASDISYPMREKITQFGLQDHLHIIQNEELNPSPETIARQLAPIKMSEDQMAEVLSRFENSEHSDAAIHLLKDHVHIFTPAHLSQMHTELHQKIVNLVEQKGGKEEEIFYYIPQDGKSYGLTTMQYQMVNKIPPEKIISDQNGLIRDFRLADGRKPTIVVLDDVAASGKSLYHLNQALKVMDYFPLKNQQHLILAPLLATHSTENYVNNMLKIEADNYQRLFQKCQRDCTFLPAKTVSALKAPLDHKTFDCSLTLKQQEIVKQDTDDNMQMWMNIVFPYMSPDNNNLWFADQIAPHFTLNGAGVKRGQQNHQYKFPS